MRKCSLLLFILFSQFTYSKSVILHCVEVGNHFYEMSYEPPIGFVYENGFEVTEENSSEAVFRLTTGNAFLVMINTETLDGYLTYDHRYLTSHGARIFKRTSAIQKKEKVIKSSTHYIFSNENKSNNFPAILINRKDLSKSALFSEMSSTPNEWAFIPCTVVDKENYDYWHREARNIRQAIQEQKESENLF